MEKGKMVQFERNFVQKGIQDMAARWVDDPTKTDKYQESAQKVTQVLAALRDKISEIYMLDLISDYSPF
ncbi:Chitinase II [Penicillium concentricum]|uniref:Chitinase II n=1 Tax=Penicillium concentricum TaxID=293559 RepID=A0A9W9UWB6_9EURO|nr:Chitinase II [Penicillium concentricum]KAJ5359787.1 Chitinase II [Penicillium concentricum]